MSYISKWRLQNNSVVPVGSNLFGTCNSGSSDTTKVVSLSAFNVLVEGVTIHVYFANANSGSNTLLQVGSTSAQPIKRNGVAEGKWESGSVISFTYSQGYWVQNDADVGGGGGETYTLSKNGNFITLTGSGGDTSSVIDDNTTYAIAVNGYQIVLTDSDGYSQRVTLPNGMYIVDDSNTLDEICGAYNDDRVIYYQYWENASTLRFLPLAEIDCSDHALFAQIINDGTDTYLLIAMVDENDDWSTSAIPIEATDTTYTISISGNDLTLTPSSGTAQTITLPIPSPTTTTPIMDGTADVGSETNYARGDHVHPSDTSKQDTLVSGTNIKTINGNSILGSGNLTTPDDDTTYTFSISGSTLTITDSDGNTQTITLPSGGGEHIELTQAQYNALPQSEKDDPNKVYFITDGTPFPQSFIDAIYPVGSYYETSDSTFDPNVSWGGTWALETEGQVHVSAGGGYLVNGANSNTSDGGTKDSVVVSHHHLVSSGWQTASGQSDKITYGAVSGGYRDSGYGSVQFIQDTGVSGTDKNMPPYIVVYRWHRTA